MLCTLLLGREESTDGVMNVGAEADCATFTVDHAELVNRGKNGSYIPPDPKPGGYNLCL